MRRVLVIASVLGVAFAMACGSNPIISDDIAILDGDFFDTTLPPDAAGFDVAKIDTGPLYNGGGPFDCFGCICDGTLNICINGGGGGGPPKAPILDASDDGADADDAGDAGAGDADATPPCPTGDAGYSACVAIPLSCLPKPTCECIEQVLHTGCQCTVTSDGDGFLFECPPRP